MNKFINSPIVVAIFVVASLFVLKAQKKPRVATEIRAAYNEIISIAEEASTDPERSKAIQAFAEEMARQIREGFAAGFKTPPAEQKEKKESREAKFLRVKDQVVLSEAKLLSSTQKNLQKFMYQITNQLDVPIKSVKVNYEFYRGDTLIDVKNQWISEIKALAPREHIAINGQRFLHGFKNDEELEAMKCDRIELSVTSFDLVEN